MRLYELAGGIDHTPVISNCVRKQVSSEDTFPDDKPLRSARPIFVGLRRRSGRLRRAMLVRREQWC